MLDDASLCSIFMPEESKNLCCCGQLNGVIMEHKVNVFWPHNMEVGASLKNLCKIKLFCGF